MNWRRQHPATAAARRTRFYKACGSERHPGVSDDASAERTSRLSADDGGASSRRDWLSEQVDAPALGLAQEAA